MWRATPSTPRADVPTDEKDINNSDFQLLNTQYVPGTVLSALSALTHLILTISTQLGAIILISLQMKLRIREEKNLSKVTQFELLVE